MAAKASVPADTGLVVEGSGDTVQGRAPGVSREVLRKLRAGEPRPQRQLDLHGLTSDEAKRRLIQVFDEVVRAGQRTVLVIHGRGLGSGPGGPVLAPLVLQALLQPPLAPRVLAFARPPGALGGPGALLVLLRKGP